MAKKKQMASGRNRSQRQSYEDYYDEENRRSEQGRVQFQRYDEPEAVRYSSYAAPRKKTSNQPKKRKKSQYRLAQPGKLIFVMGLFLMILVLLFLLLRSQLGGSTASEENTQSPVQVVQNYTGTTETGTVRPVSSTDLGSMPHQLAVYMASMIHTNLENYKKDPNTQTAEPLPSEQIKQEDYRFFIAIDAGHGGTDAGWEMNDVKEKDITLAMAEKVVSYICSNAPDYYAFLTRGNDENMGDQQRLAKAEQTYAGLLVSLHCNGSQEELGGTSAAYWTGEGDDSTRASHSQMLAEELMEAAADGFGMWSRETRIEDTPILRTAYPSIIVEMGYVTYGLDNELMADEELQNAAAAKIGQVLIDYMDEVAPDKPVSASGEDSEGNQSTPGSGSN